MAANDNFANAIVLTSQYNQTLKDYDDRVNWVAGDNVGTTQETGEPPCYLRTVWYKWIAPDPAKSRSSKWQLMTGYNREIVDGQGNPPAPTKIDTIISVYQKTDPNLPWAITNLTQILRDDAMSGWEKGSNVTIPISSAGQEFYVRIDAKKFDKVTQTFVGDEGAFVLSWKPLLDIRLLPCVECPPESGPGWQCVGVVTPDTFSENSPSFGTMPRGSYLLKYCGGAFNYNGGWAVANIPEAADHTWPGDTNPYGYFLTAVIGGNTVAFQEPTNPGKGWPNQQAAEFAARCMRISFELQASSEVKLRFTDQDYTDNTPGTVSPHYGLYRLTPIFKIDSAGILRAGAVGTTRYNATISVRNLTQRFFFNIFFTLAASGGVSSPTAPITQSFNPNSAANVGFSYDMLPLGKTNGVLTIKVSHPVYDPIPDLTINLLPLITTKLLVAQPVFMSGPATAVYLNVGNKSFGPTYNVNAVITATGGDGAPMTTYDTNGNPQNTFNLGQISGSTVGNGNLLFYLRSRAGASVTIAYHDTLMNYPSASISVPAV